MICTYIKIITIKVIGFQQFFLPVDADGLPTIILLDTEISHIWLNLLNGSVMEKIYRIIV